ncbi:ribonucleotide-diphosphate reductase subunit beta, partial [Candidatus Dependentiae bacterium]|nr:ribonucleotide-diphosphate reductase subunit beta [Candidatus Dependentiae bacterium]
MAIINNNGGITDPNKILPMHYLWARKFYKDGIANTWVPEEISMQADIEQWKSATALTPAVAALV